jgi:hypothetical protein
MLSSHIAHVGAVLGLSGMVMSGAACTVSTDASTATTGALEVSWNVASATDPAMCAMYGATSLVAQLTDSAGNSYGSWSATCAAFALNIPSLPPASFTLTGMMVDGNGQPVSTNAGPVGFTVVAGMTSTAMLSFPATSFTGQGGTGTLVLSWSIDGQQDPALCTSHNVDSIHFRLKDVSGNLVGSELMQSCSSFSTSSPYPAGSYTMTGELYSGATARTTSATAPITITNGASTQQTVDFPETAFLSP